MLNIIGHIPARERVLAIQGAHLHLYGKAPTEKRKVGHVTLVGRSLADLKRGTAALEAMVAQRPG
jgi:5-(carboxyamino)imidazole ribonucleotide synthase